MFFFYSKKYQNFVVGSKATEDEIRVLYVKSHIKSTFNVCFIDDCYREVGTAEAHTASAELWLRGCFLCGLCGQCSELERG